MTLRFLRNKLVEVEPCSDGTLDVFWRLTDDLLKVDARLKIQPPELEITEAEVRMDRFPPSVCQSAPELFEDIEGVTIGPGLRKIVHGLFSGPGGCSILADAVLESANAVILHFTRPAIQAGESVTDVEEKLANTRAMLNANPRLIRSCVAFQDDSPIMQGIEIQGGEK
jgi:hypothetical protein